MQNMRSMMPSGVKADMSSENKRKKFNSGFMKKKKTMPGSGMNKLVNAMK